MIENEHRKTVLVVDDSSANLQLCRGLLSTKYNVRLAKSGSMALEAVFKLKLDIILLDIEMPDMSGLEVMKVISKNPNLSNIPVIFLTAHATKEFVTQAASYGAADYIVKPFDADVLRAKIQSALLTRSQ